MESAESKMRRFINYYEKMAGSRDPLTIARLAGISVVIMPLGEIAGNYKLINRKRWIFVNSNIPATDPFFKVVVAHELGHALLHRKENCAFMKNKTLLLTSRIEREANRFAAYLLISDSDVLDFAEFTTEQFCDCTGYPMELIKLRINRVS